MRATERTFTTSDQETKDQGLVTESNQPKSKVKVAWGCQASLKCSINSASKLAQGVKSSNKIIQTPLGYRTAQQSQINFLKPVQVFPRESYRVKVDPDSPFLPKPPQLDASLGFISLSYTFMVPAGWFLAMEEFARRAAINAGISEAVYGSLVNTLAPTDKRSQQGEEQVVIAHEAAGRAISAAVAASANAMLVRRDVVLEQHPATTSGHGQGGGGSFLWSASDGATPRGI